MKLIPIITNLSRKEEPDIRRIAKRYFDRWPNQENIFKDAVASLKVDTNHGYKKQVVENRVVLRKKEELEQNLRGITKKLGKATREKDDARNYLTKLKNLYKSRKQMCQKEISDLYARIGLPTISAKERQKSLSRLRYLEKKLTKLSERYVENLSRSEMSLKNKERHEKNLLTQKRNKETEIKSLNLERVLYEIKTEKDHLMSNLKMLLMNLSSYTQRQYFPQDVHRFTMESMMKAFYFQDGYVKEKKKRVDVTLHSYDEPDLQEAVEYACANFNNNDLRTPEGQRIWMHVEGQNVKF